VEKAKGVKEILWTGLGWTIALLIGLGQLLLALFLLAALGNWLEPKLEEWLVP
jgi:hypothetical protein